MLPSPISPSITLLYWFWRVIVFAFVLCKESHWFKKDLELLEVLGPNLSVATVGMRPRPAMGLLSRSVTGKIKIVDSCWQRPSVFPSVYRARMTCQMSRWTTESVCRASAPNTWIWRRGRVVWERAGSLNAFSCDLDGWNFPECLEGHLNNPWRGNGRIQTILDGSWVTKVSRNREDYLFAFRLYINHPLVFAQSVSNVDLQGTRWPKGQQWKTHKPGWMNRYSTVGDLRTENIQKG